jgi:hypothetical protein
MRLPSSPVLNFGSSAAKRLQTDCSRLRRRRAAHVQARVFRRRGRA